MLVIVPICDRIKLLPYFLRYYSSIGATRFECALYNGAKSPFYQQILDFRSTYDLHVRMSIACGMEEYDGNLVAPVLNVIRKECASKFDWYCIADLDEFHFFGGRTLLEVVKSAAALGYDAVHGMYSDRIAIDGTFPEIDGRPLDEIFPLACDITRFCGGCCHKIVLAKNHVEITGGHHNAAADRIWRHVGEVHHFKWVKGVDKVMEDRYRREKNKELPWAEKLPKLINILKGRIDISNPKLNVRKASIIGI